MTRGFDSTNGLAKSAECRISRTQQMTMVKERRLWLATPGERAIRELNDQPVLTDTASRIVLGKRDRLQQSVWII
jgi:hypothetical protein